MAPLWLTASLAFVAPIAALGGVWLGQWMHRRTTREQLAEHRRRDRELWDREDRHRWTAEKRVVYAEYLAVAERYEAWSMSTIIDLKREIGEPEQAAAAGIDVDEFHDSLVTGSDYERRSRDFDVELRNAQAQVELIAPTAIASTAVSVTGKLCAGPLFFVYAWNSDAARDVIAEALGLRQEMTEEMRKDLAGVESPAVGS